MLRYLAILALIGVGAVQPPTTSSWPLRHFVKWQQNWGRSSIDVAGVVVRVESRRCGKDRPASEACYPGSTYLTVTVGGAGMTPVTLESEPGVAAYIAIGKLSSDALRSSLILVSESGGSAGCVRIDLAVPQGNAYRNAGLGSGGNGRGMFCEVDPARLAWPADLTGQGRPEFLLSDTVFHCRFTSCAGSWYPPRVVAFDGRRGVDVSADPALSPLYRADMAKARHACEYDRSEAQGACAGFAADAARLGQLPQAWRIIETQTRRGCRVPFADVCPDVASIPATFPEELAAVLSRAGYR